MKRGSPGGDTEHAHAPASEREPRAPSVFGFLSSASLRTTPRVLSLPRSATLITLDGGACEVEVNVARGYVGAHAVL